MSVTLVIGLFLLVWSLPLAGLLVLFIAHVRAERREERQVAETMRDVASWSGQP